jgi:hypothetical protein
MATKPCTYVILAALLLASACAPARGYSRDILETVTPMSASLRTTLTARAVEAASGGDSLATAVFNATQQAQSINATQTARAALYEPARLATASAIAPAVAELPLYGIGPADGYVAWVHDPATIELAGYRQTGHATDYPLVTAADFVVATDITWNTAGGIGSCGFLFRSDGDSKKPTQYMVMIERLAGGRVIFGATVGGEVSNYNYFYPKANDPSFDWSNDSTNRLALVVRGDIIDVYSNGTYVGQWDITDEPPPPPTSPSETALPPGLSDDPLLQQAGGDPQNDQAAQALSENLTEARKNFVRNQPFFYDGFIAFLAAVDTGTATCAFQDSWLFMIEK